jgi:hypothetical protein
MDEFVSRYLKITKDTRQLITDVHARYFGTELSNGSLVPAGAARIGSIYFDDWMRQSTAKK